MCVCVCVCVCHVHTLSHALLLLLTSTLSVSLMPSTRGCSFTITCTRHVKRDVCECGNYVADTEYTTLDMYTV